MLFYLKNYLDKFDIYLVFSCVFLYFSFLFDHKITLK